MLETNFDNEYCEVKYIEQDRLVFLRWKKFASFENYRKPTTFALQLLQTYEQSNFVIDARNGFEDEAEDVQWGFRFLLPEMAKTDCKKVVFIMEEENCIEAEMDMWSLAFGKYFSVYKVCSYEDACLKVNS